MNLITKNIITTTVKFKSTILVPIFLLAVTFSVAHSSPSQDQFLANKTELKSLLLLQDKELAIYLEAYFGKDYSTILRNQQIYRKFIALTKKMQLSSHKPLRERYEMLKKVKSHSFEPKLQKNIYRAFIELRFKDVRDILDNYLRDNKLSEYELTKVHYIKALSFMAQLNYPEAKNEFEKITPNTKDAEIYSDYAFTYSRLNNYDKALEYYKKTAKLKFSFFNEELLHIDDTYRAIGKIYYKKRDYDKAIEYHKKALKIRLSTILINHHVTAESYNDIALALHRKKEYDKALKYYEKALKLQIISLGKHHPDSALSYNNIGTIWYDKGDYDKAIEYYKKTLNADLGKEWYFTATVYNSIGVAHYSKKEYSKAIEYYKKALSVYQKTLSDNDIRIKSIYKSIKKAQEALKK